MKATYFAYGSNMSRRQMCSRCPSAHVLSTAILSGYRVTFIQPPEEWGGGVAGLVHDCSDIVEGVVYELSAQDLDALDGFEPVAEGKYWRERIDIRLPDDNTIEAWTYFGSVFPDAPFVPSQHYLNTLIKGAVEHGLSRHYVRRLRSWQEGFLP